MPQRLSSFLNSAANGIIEYSHTAVSKAVVWFGAASATTQLSTNWVDATYRFFAEFPWLNTLSAVSLVLLIVERSFVIWANWRKNKRGDW